ncbi:alpha/beta hydrolase fold domain-containing protein [Tricladium varicosporioides]|nr:alpha/beta hydrolase fold domain-containing protein [Hymenoscyphus varicosporioides]
MAVDPQPRDSQTFTLPSGRSLGFATYGSPSPGTPVIFYFHGFPTTRIEGSFAASTKAKPYVVAIDRPGIGLSSFQPARRILDWPSDVLAIADHLNIEKFHVIGASGGSPYALVCAKEIPRARLLSVSVVSGIYPISLGTEGMLLGVRALLYGGAWLPRFVMAKVLDWEFGTAARNKDPKVFEDSFMKGMEKRAERDMRCLDDLPFRKTMVESMREAFRQGAEGPAWDCSLYGDWGFNLEEINGEGITLWHGKEDPNAPAAMAIKAAKLMKGCELRIIEGECHMSLSYHHIEEILQSVKDLGLD